MAYNTELQERIDGFFKWKGIHFESKKMMGGLAYMVDNKMCVGIIKDQLMARVGPKFYDNALEREGVSPMDFTGKPMKGYVYVDEFAHKDDSDLQFWIEKCLEFNPKAKASKKKSK